MSGTLILLRHGQSEWNLANRFTGWHDVDLTAQGRDEALAAARELIRDGLVPDVAYTSVLKRAIRTLWIVLEEMDLMWIPVHRHWRLNERHYGALQGLDKAETSQRHGEEQVKIWRRSYDIPPPPVADDDSRHPRNDPRYARLDRSALPATESLKSTLDRVRPYWQDVIAPDVAAGRSVLIAAHGNSLRALVKMLEGMSDEEIIEFNMPTGVPRLYRFDDQMRTPGGRFMGDPEAIAAAAAAVAAQARGPRT